MNRVPIAIVFVLSLAVAACGQETVAVVNFINRNSPDDWDWLEKGFADLLITDLARSDKMLVVERERMQDMLTEMRLGGTGLMEAGTAQQLGRALAVGKVLTGSYRVTGEGIEIEAHIADVMTGKLTRVEVIEGKAGEVLQLEKKLALALLERLEAAPTEEQLAAIKRIATDDLDAARHHYLALDALDRGQLFAGLRESIAAVRRDPGFLRSRYLAAKLYFALDRDAHALVELEGLVGRHEDEAIEIRAGMRAYEILRGRHKDNARALGLCERLLAEYTGRRMILSDAWAKAKSGKGKGPGPGQWVAREGYLIEEEVNLWRTDLLIEENRPEEAIALALPLKNRFNRGLFIESVEAYFRKHVAAPRLSEGLVYVSPDAPEFRADFSEAGWEGKAARCHLTRKRGDEAHAGLGPTYLLAAPEGLEFEDIEIEVFSTEGWCEIFKPFGLYAGGGEAAKLQHYHRRLVARPGARMILMNVILKGTLTSDPGWMRVKANFREATPYGWLAFEVDLEERDLEVDGEEQQVDSEGKLRIPAAVGRHLVEVRDPSRSLGKTWVSVKEGETTTFRWPEIEAGPAQAEDASVTLAADVNLGSAAAVAFEDGRVLCVASVSLKMATGTKGELHAAHRSANGAWTTLAPLPSHINDLSRSFAPRLLAHGEQAVLYFASDRSRDLAFHAARSDDLVNWTAPVRWEELRGGFPSVVRFGERYIAVVARQRENDVLVFSSKDLESWEDIGSVPKGFFGQYHHIAQAGIGTTGEGELLVFVLLSLVENPLEAVDEAFSKGEHVQVGRLLLFRTSDPTRWSRPIEPICPNTSDAVTLKYSESDYSGFQITRRAPLTAQGRLPVVSKITRVPGGVPIALVADGLGFGGQLYEIRQGGEMWALGGTRKDMVLSIATAGENCWVFGWDLRTFSVEKLPGLDYMRHADEYRVKLDQVRESVRRGDLEKAEELIRELEGGKGLGPKVKAAILDYKGKIAEKRGDKAQALQQIEEKREAFPEDYSPYEASRTGWNLLQLGRNEEAVKEYRSRKEYMPAGPYDSALLLANVLAETGDLEGACSEVREVLSIDPNAFEARLLLAVFLYYGERTDEALACTDLVFPCEGSWNAYAVRALVSHDGASAEAEETLRADREAISAITRPRASRGIGSEWVDWVDTLLGEDASASDSRGSESVCAEQFWQGVKARWEGDARGAAAHFKQARERGKVDYWPYVAAGLELGRLGER